MKITFTVADRDARKIKLAWESDHKLRDKKNRFHCWFIRESDRPMNSWLRQFLREYHGGAKHEYMKNQR